MRTLLLLFAWVFRCCLITSLHHRSTFGREPSKTGNREYLFLHSMIYLKGENPWVHEFGFDDDTTQVLKLK